MAAGPEFESSPGIATDGIVTPKIMRAWLGTDGDFTGGTPAAGESTAETFRLTGIRRASHPPQSPGCSCQRTHCVVASYGAALNFGRHPAQIAGTEAGQSKCWGGTTTRRGGS